MKTIFHLAFTFSPRFHAKSMFYPTIGDIGSHMIVIVRFINIITIFHDTCFFFIRTKFKRTQAFGHPEIKNMVRTQGFPQQ